jgi:hypothetical protein
MSTIQKDLNSAFVDSIQLRKNIIRICRDHFALINELNNASINVPDLINALHTSVMNYEAIRKQHDSQQIYLQQNDLTQQIHLLNQNQIEFENQYFIDRQYRRDESFFNRRESFRDRDDRFQARRSKKCFVYEKPDC